MPGTCPQRDIDSGRFVRRYKHGTVKTSEYRAWDAMLRRCLNPDHPYWKDYGDRGITVCTRWIESFENFLTDMGPKPTRRHSLDRKDNELGYSPENCRWSTSNEQCRNRRRLRGTLSPFRGVTKPMWSKRWLARLWIGNRSYLELGSFIEEVDAAQAWNLAAYERFGDSAIMNTPDMADRR